MTDGIARPQVALTTAPIEHQKRKKTSENLAHFLVAQKCGATTSR
jgi:hypothetical protein